MKKSLFLLTGTLFVGGGFNAAHAQREAPTRQERRQERQGGLENMTPEERQQRMMQRWQDRYQNASPEQRQRMDQMRQQIEGRLREAGIDPTAPDAMQRAQEAGINLFGGGPGGPGGGPGGQGGRGNWGGGQPQVSKDEQRRQLMIASGITDAETQNAILAFVNAQETNRAELLRLAKEAAAALKPTLPRVMQAGAPIDTTASDAKVVSTFNAYQTALTEDRTRYAEALKELDTKISYSTKPRVKAFLSLAGILEYDSLSLGGVPVIFPGQQQQQNEGNNWRQARGQWGNRGGGGEGGMNLEGQNADQEGGEAPQRNWGGNRGNWGGNRGGNWGGRRGGEEQPVEAAPEAPPAPPAPLD